MQASIAAEDVVGGAKGEGLAGAGACGTAGLGLDESLIGNNLEVNLKTEVVAAVAWVIAEIVLTARSHREASHILDTARGETAYAFIVAALPTSKEIEAVVACCIWVAMKVAIVEMEGGFELAKIGFLLAIARPLAGTI